MPRFRVSDLMINVGEGGGDFPCELITECGGVTELCVENTQGCAFTENCRCTIRTCGFPSCECSFCSLQTCGCTPCSRGCTYGCTFCSNCTACSRVSVCTFRSICGISVRCTPTADTTTTAGLTPEYLSALKAELRATLERVEAEEERLTERLQPQTLDEVTKLEEKLNEALDELRQRRSELEGREKEKGE
jgi:hypothetical protein